jgi:hypothetical protein
MHQILLLGNLNIHSFSIIGVRWPLLLERGYGFRLLSIGVVRMGRQ